MGGDTASSRRITPYDRPSRGGSRFSRDKDRGTMKRLGVPLGGRGGGRQADETQWYKVIIPYGKNVSKDFITQSIANMIDVPLIPMQFHHYQKSAVFYVQGETAGNKIRNVTRKIQMPNGIKMVIQVVTCKPPQGAAGLADNQTEEKLKVVMSGRYDPALKSLNLSDLYNDSDLNKEGLHLPLNKFSNTVLNIIQENIPELEQLDVSNNRLYMSSLRDISKKAPNVKCLNLRDNSIREESDLDYIKNLPIEELHLEGNPICDRQVLKQIEYM